MNMRQVMRFACLLKDFDGTVRRELGPDVADNYAADQHDIASKIHRGTVPASFDGIQID
jgi:hypothetical protein